MIGLRIIMFILRVQNAYRDEVTHYYFHHMSHALITAENMMKMMDYTFIDYSAGLYNADLSKYRQWNDETGNISITLYPIPFQD